MILNNFRKQTGKGHVVHILEVAGRTDVKRLKVTINVKEYKKVKEMKTQ